MNKSLLLTLSSVFLGMGISLQAGGIPHPSFQIHGGVYNHGDGYRRLLDVGEIEITFESEHGRLLTSTARIRKGDSVINYVLEVPAEIGSLRFPASGDVVDLGTESEQLWHLTDSVRIEYHGVTYRASWERGTSTDLEIKRSAWGGLRRLDLMIEAPPHDHDGGAIPDDWERLYADAEGGFGGGDGGGDSIGGGGGSVANPFAGESSWLREGEEVWVKSGVATVVRFPLSAGRDPLVKEDLHYTFIELPEEGVFEWVDESTGAVAPVSAGDTFPEARLEEGRLRYTGAPGGAGSVTALLQMNYAGEHESEVEEVSLQVWEPSTGGPSGARIWMNAQRQGVDSDSTDGLRNYADVLGEEWGLSGRVSLPEAGGRSFDFVDGAATSPVGSSSTAALAAPSVEILIAFEGEPGPVLTSAHLGLDHLPGELSGYEQLRFGRRDAAVASEKRGNPSGVEVFHAWLREGEFALSRGGDLSGIGFTNPDPAPMGERAAIGARWSDGDEPQAKWTGSLHELLVFDRRLNEIERARLHAYFLAKSGIGGPVIVDAAHSIRPVVQFVPPGPAGDDAPHLFLGWQAKTWFEGGAADDAFYVGAGEHVLAGGGGRNRFVFLLEGGHDHRIRDFSRENDVLDLSVLFREPISGPVGNYLRASQDGEDSILEVYRTGPAQSTPSLTLRFEDWMGLTQERVSELLRKGVIQAGALEIRPVVQWALQRGEAEKTGDEPAHFRLTWNSGDLPTGQAIPLRIRSTDATPGEDFRLLAKQFDPETGEFVTAPVSEVGLRVPPEEHSRIDLFLEPIPNRITEEPREIILSFFEHPVRYRQSGGDEERTALLLDGPTVVTIEALAEVAGPESPTEFVIERMGALDRSLHVRLDVGGTAANSIDYEFIGSTAVFQKGISSISLPLRPLREVQSEDQNRVVLRIEEGSDYRYTGDGMARVWLAVTLRELRVVKISEIADANPNGSRIAQFFVRKSDALEGEDLLVNLGLEGNVALSRVSVAMPNVVADLNYSGDSGNKVLLLPADTSSFILTIKADANPADGSGGHYLDGAFSPFDGGDFTVAPADGFTIYFREDIEAWALRHGADAGDVMGWLLAESESGGLTNLEAYTFGVSPGTSENASTAMGVEVDTEENRLRIRVPFYPGSADAVAATLEGTTDLVDWVEATGFEVVGDERAGDRFYRIYSGPSTAEPAFFRIRMEPR